MDYTVREDVGSAAVVVTVSGGVVTSAIVISVISSDDQATGNQTLISKIVFDLRRAHICYYSTERNNS